MTTQNNSLDFKNQQFYIGLDVHKKRWVVTIRSNKMELKTFSMDPVAEQLNKYMEKNYPGGKYYSVYEAGFCGYGLHRELESYGFKNIIAAPTEIPTSNKEKNKIKGYLHFYGHKLPENCEVRHWTKNFIEHLRKLDFNYSIGKEQLSIYLYELTEIRKLLVRIIKQIKNFEKEHNLQEEITLLCSVPGVGFVVAITLLTELIDPKRFPDLDNLASYVGLVPCILSSSEKETKLGIKFHRNRFLREPLLEAAWVAVRKDPALTYSYNNYIRRMSKQEAIIRIAKKLLSRINYVWTNKKSYVNSVVK